jgi:pimeloyl-ACP methyl ester carboxylesterase
MLLSCGLAGNMTDKFLWFYSQGGETWKLFNDVDQSNLETEHESQGIVKVHGGRYIVDLRLRRMQSLFIDPVDEYDVCRSSWILIDNPLPEDQCPALSAWCAADDKVNSLNIGTRKFYKNSDGSVMMAGQTLVSPSVRLTRLGSTDIAPIPPSANGDDPSIPIDHLIICVHGIGEAMWSRKVFNREPFDAACDSFRALLADFRQEQSNRTGRIEVLHVKWFQILSESSYAQHINDITLPTVPVLRQFANGAVSDVLFYLNEKHKHDILQHVSKRINGIIECFKKENQDLFTGNVSLVGHSLGSVICYDLLLQNRLLFDIEKLFLLGSPLGMFLTSRGDIRDFIPIPRCPQIMNVFHPNDPVAYRLEPLINPLLRDAGPELVPYYLTGGLATHTKLKQATTSIINMFTGPDNLRGTSTYMEKLSQFIKGNTSPKPESPLGIAIREVESLNDGARIDWSLQQESLVTNEYAEAVSAHVTYLRDKSIARFINEQLR